MLAAFADAMTFLQAEAPFRSATADTALKPLLGPAQLLLTGNPLLNSCLAEEKHIVLGKELHAAAATAANGCKEERCIEDNAESMISDACDGAFI